MTRYQMVWRANNRTVITHAFLDNGSSATICTESLVRKLGVEGTKVKISLSTLEKKNSPVESYLIRDLVVSDLDESDFVSLPALYTRPEIPVCEEDIPTQEDVDQWPHLGISDRSGDFIIRPERENLLQVDLKNIIKVRHLCISYLVRFFFKL